jgi:hypothetical protein
MEMNPQSPPQKEKPVRRVKTLEEIIQEALEQSREKQKPVQPEKKKPIPERVKQVPVERKPQRTVKHSPFLQVDSTTEMGAGEEILPEGSSRLVFPEVGNEELPTVKREMKNSINLREAMIGSIILNRPDF